MPEENDRSELPLERYRTYLLLIARMQLDDRPRQKVDASDIVQQTLIEAHEKRDQFRSDSGGGLAAWFLQIRISADRKY